MENKKKIGLAALWLITCMIGASFVSAARETPIQQWNPSLGRVIANIGVFISNTEANPVPVSIEGTVTVEGGGECSSTPETKYIERILDYPETGVHEVVNLEGYKDLQISWVFDIEYDEGDIYGGVLSLYWCTEDGHQVGDGEIWYTGELHPGGDWGTKSTKVQSNYLTIQVVNDNVHSEDKIRLILYATK